jgi:acyl transferase domain-containing protein/3-hydroxymyristoyl/3-hydroxydecanoyl-(acyl carrier protein) dehydratase
MSVSDPVAIVGLAGRFPGCGADLGRFWENVAAGRDCSGDVPPGRWVLPPQLCCDSRVPHPDSVYSTRGYFLDPFEPDLTGLAIPADLVAELDPLVHLVLDVGNRAWRSAKTDRLDRRKVGVVLGNICLPTEKSNALCREVLGGSFGITPQRPTHPLNRYVAGLPAGLLAKGLGLGGGTFTLDAACASTLYALKLAADELLAGRADAMLAGGCNRADSQYTQMGFAQLRALSVSGRCSPFDAAADGLMVGEGAGIFVLKRLADALRDGDTIHAVLCGWGLSNDLGANLLSPAVEGQLRAMRAAYRRAGWQPSDVQFIECHATGTPVGDAIEFESLCELWNGSTWRPGQCAIGSVKATVGHLLTGAGAAAVLKVVQAFAAGKRPPQANFTQPGPNLRYADGPFRVLTEAEGWDAPDVRRAAVSGFGFGGVNAHLLFEQYVGQSYASPKVSGVVPRQAEPIAVVGLAAHVGPWSDVRAFQEYVLGGGVSHSPQPKRNGWELAATPCPPGYFVEELRVPLDRFRIPPKELEEMLPQQVLMLQMAAAALDDAGGTTGEADPRTGVFIGLGLDLNTTNYHLRWAALARSRRGEAWENEIDAASPALNANRVMGALGSIAASRIARAFQFGGPSFTTCSEETSAGRAVELAVRALRAGEIDRALVGGVDFTGDPRIVQTAPAGTILGEGAAALVLKRLADAARDGDRVYAVLTGIGCAGGGSADSTTPDAATYASSLMRACADGLTDPATLAYLDGPAGDCEADALAALLAVQTRPFPLAAGSAVRQVGHTGFASGAVALVKACLAIYQQILPANPPRFWLTNADTPRRAAVGCVGVDGSSIHMVLEEYANSPQVVERIQPLGSRAEAIFAVEADTPADLADELERLAAGLPAASPPIEALARDWFRRQPPNPQRKLAVALAARSADELREQIAFAAQSLRSHGDIPTADLRPALRDRVFFSINPLGRVGKLAFVFPGSGNHFPGMGRDLGLHWPEVLRRQQSENRRLRDQYVPDLFWAEAIPPQMTPRDALFGQVATGTLIADLLAVLGVKPDAMIGLSLGESAGLFGLRVWTARDDMDRRTRETTLFNSDLAPPYDAARTFYQLSPDAPLEWVTGVLTAPADAVRPHLRPGLKAYLQIITTPSECVVGGCREDVEQLVAAVGQPFLPLAGVTLAHCEAGKPVESPYRELHRLPVTPPDGLTIYSGAWGRPYEPSEQNAADSITAGLLNTIDFPQVIEAAYQDGVRVFVEIGPGNSCVRMIDAILGDRPHLARAAHAPRQDAVSQLLRLAANLIAERLPLSLAALYGAETVCAGHRPPTPEPKRLLVLPVGSPPREPREPRPTPPTPTPTPTISPERNGGLATVPQAHPARGAIVPDFGAFAAAAAATQQAAGEAHGVFLRVQTGFTQTTAAALQLQTELLRRMMGGQLPSAGRLSAEPILAEPQAEIVSPPRREPPRSLNTEQCFAFARGKVGDVLGPLYAEVDTFPTRVRLPDGPLMLVDRILRIEGEPKSLTSGRVITDHTVRPDRWYLEAGRCPTSVTVEAGQADLFLSGFLGIDFQTRGEAVYRLLDAVVTFHRGLPKVGERIEYDIRIDEFVRQADAWLFRFRFEGTVNGEPLLSMQNGVAGFFTPAALQAGQGIVHTKLDRQPMPRKKPADWRDFVPPESGSLTTEQVEALRRGDLVTAFGDEFAWVQLNKPQPLPGGMLRLVDRVPVVDPTGGRFGLGFVRAEYDIRPNEWFIECHFVDDKVMPGTLMYECCLHTLRILLMRMGWVGEAGEVVCEPVPGVNSRLKCRGQVLETTGTVTYEVSVKELGYRPEPYAIADALMYADGKPIVEITNMSLRMTGLTRPKLEAIWGAGPGTAAPRPRAKAALYGPEQILAFSNGKPSEAFGEPYRVFDSERVIARLPGPPFQFLDRITAVSGKPFVLKAGARCEAEYDVPADAWYFAANRCPKMPFSVLLEIALQPCGWLAAYCGSALTSETDLSFRNLGGQATQFEPVGPDIGTLTTTATLTKVASSAGMIIQHYDFCVRQAGRTVYEGNTYFGFFSKEALKNQVGIPNAAVPILTDDQQAFADRGELPHDPPFPEPMLRMIDRIDGYLPHGGAKRLGLVQGRIAVDPDAWFFKAHFYQDPVWPGSLGLESFLQLLKYVAWKKWGNPPPDGWQTVALNRPHSWVYRGQVIPTDREVTAVLDVTAADPSARRLTADGFLIVDGRTIYQMTGFTLE